jgi:hypothetical protein
MRCIKLAFHPTKLETSVTETTRPSYTVFKDIKREALENVDNTLDSREKEYGHYCDLAYLLEKIIEAYESSVNYRMLKPYQKVALYMDAMKTVRILNGNPSNIDSWHDKAGYAELVVKELRKEQANDK